VAQACVESGGRREHRGCCRERGRKTRENAEESQERGKKGTCTLWSSQRLIPSISSLAPDSGGTTVGRRRPRRRGKAAAATWLGAGKEEQQRQHGLVDKGGGGAAPPPCRRRKAWQRRRRARTRRRGRVRWQSPHRGRAREGTVAAVWPGKGWQWVPVPCRRLLVRGSGSPRGRRRGALLCSLVNPVACEASCRCRRQDREADAGIYFRSLLASLMVRLGRALVGAIAQITTRNIDGSSAYFCLKLIHLDRMLEAALTCF
ncbi:unnamed protein product, partial [Urochloa humidicola]